MRLKSIFLLSTILGVSFADTLTLKSGKTVDGTYMGGDTREIRMAVGQKIEVFALNDVASIHFVSAPVTATPAEPAAVAAPAAPAAPVVVAAPAAPAVQSTGVEVPAGTQLVIRMIDDVDSSRDRVGQTFRASVDEPVMVAGNTVIPRGADVLTKLVDDKQSGRFTGRTELTLDVVSLTVGGRTMDIKTQEVTMASSSRTGSTAKVVGGTAALGAIIGAVAGGGRGAAIGAASGAGVGGAVQVLTKGQKVKVPSESRLQFNLEQPIRL